MRPQPRMQQLPSSIAGVFERHDPILYAITCMPCWTQANLTSLN